MGLVDGCAPAMLAQVNNMSHGGTGVVYSLQTAAIQLGSHSALDRQLTVFNRLWCAVISRFAIIDCCAVLTTHWTPVIYSYLQIFSCRRILVWPFGRLCYLRIDQLSRNVDTAGRLHGLILTADVD